MSSEARHHVHAHHTHDYAAANQEHFNKMAETFDEFPGAKELAKRVVNAILAKFPDRFDEDNTSVMDFACGTGRYRFLQRNGMGIDVVLLHRSHIERTYSSCQVYCWR